MSLINLVAVIVATCLLSPCMSVAIPEAVVDEVVCLTKQRVESSINELTLIGTEPVVVAVHGREGNVYEYSKFGEIIKPLDVECTDDSFCDNMCQEMGSSCGICENGECFCSSTDE